MRVIATRMSIVFLAASAIAARAQPVEVARIAAYQGDDRTQRLVQGAAKEGLLTIYSAVPVEDNAAIVNAFQRKYGIKLNVWRAPADEVRDRVLTEARANRYVVDVVFANFHGVQPLHREGLLRAVSSPHIADLVSQAVPAHREWAAAFLTIFATGYNTNAVARDELPASYRDLPGLKPRGPIGIESGDYDWFAGVCQEMGETECLRLFREIGARHGYSVRRGHGLLTNLIAAGEVPLALSVYRFGVEQAKRKGAPIDWLAMTPLIGQPGSVALARRAPHPNAGVLFYDFAINEAQAILQERGFIVTHAKYETPLKRDSIRVVNSDDVFNASSRWQKLFDSVFLARGR